MNLFQLIKSLFKGKKKSNRKTFAKVCVVCGKKFKTTCTMQKACSKECSHELQKASWRRYQQRKVMAQKKANKQTLVATKKKATKTTKLTKKKTTKATKKKIAK